MLDLKFEVKRSKSIVIFGWVLCSIVELMFGGIALLFIYRIATEEYKIYEDPHSQFLAGIIMISFSLLIIILLIVFCVYFTIDSKIQLDIYTQDRVFRKKGNKLIFEIEYKQIETIKEGFFAFIYTFCIFCKEPIILKNGKKGPKTQMEYYDRRDREKIKQIIREYFEANNIAY